MTTKIPQGLQIRRDEKSYSEEEMAIAFPKADPGFEPFGSRVIVQLRNPPYMTGGFLLADESRETEMWNTQIAKVISVGPVAFRSRDTGELWPEGKWFQEGDFIRIPKWNQDKWFIKVKTKFTNPYTKKENESTDFLLFMLINDLDILAKKTGNPLEVKAYI